MRYSNLRNLFAFGICAALARWTLHITQSAARSSQAARSSTDTTATLTDASPVYGITIPAGYRDWKLIAVSQLQTPKTDQLHAQFGNDIALQAFKDRKLPFPDGAIIAAQHWTRVP